MAKTGKAVSGTELHTTQSTSSLQLGVEILVDTLTLSMCDVYIGVSSNIALAVSYMNPNITMHIIRGGGAEEESE